MLQYSIATYAMKRLSYMRVVLQDPPGPWFINLEATQQTSLLVSSSDCYLNLLLIQYLTNPTNLEIVRRQFCLNSTKSSWSIRCPRGCTFERQHHAKSTLTHVHKLSSKRYRTCPDIVFRISHIATPNPVYAHLHWPGSHQSLSSRMFLNEFLILSLK